MVRLATEMAEGMLRQQSGRGFSTMIFKLNFKKYWSLFQAKSVTEPRHIK